MKNKLVIPISSLGTAQQINKIMEKIFIHDDEMLNKLIAAEGDFAIEKEGFIFNDKKVDPQNGAVYLDFYFYKEIEAYVGEPFNKVQVIQYDLVCIEKKGQERRIISSPYVREPLIVMENILTEFHFGQVSVSSRKLFDFKIRVTTDDVVFDLDEFLEGIQVVSHNELTDDQVN